MENLKNRAEKLWLSISTLNNKYLDIVNQMLQCQFPNTVWFANSFNDKYLNISIELPETYSNGSHKRYTIEISHGYSSWYSIKDDKEFHLNINPFTAGEFTLLEDNSLREYFGMVGTLCTNEEFRNELITILKNYYVEFKPINDEYRAVEREIDNIKRKEAEEKKLAAKNEAYTRYKTEAQTITDGYFVIDTGDACIVNPDERTIYRKKPVRILAGAMNYDEAYSTMKSYYKSDYHKYKIVEVSKIKFTE